MNAIIGFTGTLLMGLPRPSTWCCSTAGFDHYMPKPINPRTFVAEVEARLPGQLRHRRPTHVSGPR